MILFLEDYQTHSGVIQTTTTNPSFVKMSVLLSKMGIKNNKFFLFLSQPELMHHDPHNLTDPSMELRQRIAYECKVNPWYYFREVVRIPIAGDAPTHFNLSRANLAMMWLFFNNTDLFLIMPRQLGKTIGALSIFSWCLFLGAVNSTYGLFTKDNSVVLENVSKLKDIRKALPDYLVKQSKTDTDNKEGISYDILNNEYKTFVNQSEVVSAAKQGRGETLVCQQWDEFPYYKNNHLSYPSATSASDAASRQARASGLPAANMITTTAGYLDTKSGEYAFGVKSKCIRFNELLYDIQNNDALTEVVRDNSTNRMVYMEFSYRQLGETEEWFKTVTRSKSPNEIATDYLNTWVLGTSSPVVGAELLTRIKNSVIDPCHYTTHKSLIVKWYVEKHLLKDKAYVNTPFIIGTDTSNNIGRDFTTLVILEPKTLAVVGVCRCNVTNLVHVASCICLLMEEYPNSIFMPERNANGAVMIDAVIDFLLSKGISPFRRIYNSYAQNYSEEATDFNAIDLHDGRNRNNFGFKTTGSSRSREFLYSTVLMAMLNYMADHVHDGDLADEIRGLTIRNGRVDHGTGAHDDTCISMLLAGYFILFGKNLRLYGIDTSDFFEGTLVNGKVVDPLYKEKQEEIHKRISTLKGLLLTTTNGIIRAAYERELRYLESQFDPSALEAEINMADKILDSGINNTDSAQHVTEYARTFRQLNNML